MELLEVIRVFILVRRTLMVSGLDGWNMSSEERAVAKTYVPEEQKSEWEAHAAELDMSQSEFLRTMVQAGRRGFLSDPEEGGSRDATPGGEGLEDRVLQTIGSSSGASWDELIEELSGDFEDRLEEAINSLQEANEIRHDGRRGGYVRQGDQ